ncbi:MAG: 16S rRNA (cytidine(1402)-2'-O)-methyltransferase, partial [Acidobacteriota bacterium]|nr:16S rRNA (cytidine(1402)-2'-O)-methyltransferase [Acidobacteriota bacterium]
KPTISYHEHNEQARADELVQRMLGGESIAIVSDAGTPGISDPAYRIVTKAIEHGITVVPIPGAAALIAGITASGLPTDSFLFAGFPPHKKMARWAKLEEFKNQRATLIFYEAPHRIRETLADALEIFGNRQAALARELTKLHEQFIRGNLSEIVAHFDTHEPRGEMVLVIAGSGDDNLPPVEFSSVTEQIEQLINEAGLNRNDAIKQAAKSRGLSKRDAYQLMLKEKETNEDQF